MNIPNVISAYTHQKESGINFHTELKKSLSLSQKYQANVFLKREDQQIIRLFKMRGVYNKLINTSQKDLARGISTASDGNNAQAVAYFCNHFKIKGYIFVPEVCFNWKIDLCKKFGKEYVEVISIGMNFKEAHEAAIKVSREKGYTYIHPFDDERVIEGNATMALEILQDCPGEIDYLFIPIGGGGLAAGVAAYCKALSPNTKIIGVQPELAATMKLSMEAGKPIELQDKFSRFCDGSAVSTVGKLTFELCKNNLDEVALVPDGRISTTVLDLYTQGIAVEPAGALAVSVLDQYANQIKGKRVCCIISGGTVDLSRFDEFKELSLLHEGLKHFFLIQMPLKPGILKSFVTFCLGPDDEVSHIQFHKKNNRERGPALVAIEVSKKENIKYIMEKMDKMNLQYQNINDTKELYDLLI